MGFGGRGRASVSGENSRVREKEMGLSGLGTFRVGRGRSVQAEIRVGYFGF